LAGPTGLAKYNQASERPEFCRTAPKERVPRIEYVPRVHVNLENVSRKEVAGPEALVVGIQGQGEQECREFEGRELRPGVKIKPLPKLGSTRLPLLSNFTTVLAENPSVA